MKLDGTETETVDPLSTGGLKTFLIYSIIDLSLLLFPTKQYSYIWANKIFKSNQNTANITKMLHLAHTKVLSLMYMQCSLDKNILCM